MISARRLALLTVVVLALGALAFGRPSPAEAAERRSEQRTESRIETRGVTLAWNPVPRAVGYEVELGADPSIQKILERRETKELQAELKLAPGAYYFRVRGIHALGSPGPWSEIMRVIANHAPPRTLAPAKDVILEQESLPPEGLALRWEAGIPGSVYLLELEAEDGTVTRLKPVKAELRWQPPRSGKYRWRAGFEIPTGEDWGAWSAFVINGPPPPLPGFWERLVMTAGLQLTSSAYSESRTPGHEQLAWTGKFAVTAPLTADGRWEAQASAYSTLFALSQSRDLSVRFFGWNTRLGYTLPWPRSPWRLSLIGGYYYTTMLVPTQELGFANLHGPQLFPVLRRQAASGNQLLVYLKYAPISPNFESLSLSNRELAVGGGYSFTLKNGDSVGVTLDIARLELTYHGVSLRSRSISIGGSYGF
ncbi:MAG: hypothetical protein NDJ90_06980 [Oligoflexia bacterium]|nr:hypothetical protein [Oligoflexia bacterium]